MSAGVLPSRHRVVFMQAMQTGMINSELNPSFRLGNLGSSELSIISSAVPHDVLIGVDFSHATPESSWKTCLTCFDRGQTGEASEATRSRRCAGHQLNPTLLDLTNQPPPHDNGSHQNTKLHNRPWLCPCNTSALKAKHFLPEYPLFDLRLYPSDFFPLPCVVETPATASIPLVFGGIGSMRMTHS